MNAPIYRAKKIGSDEYVIGYYSPAYDIHHYIITYLGVDTKVNVVYQMSTDIHKIDPTTLAIHFSDMIDSQGNKIFASLNNISGSILTDGEYEFNLYFDRIKYRVIGNEVNSEINDYEEWKDFKVIGIQE